MKIPKRIPEALIGTALRILAAGTAVGMLGFCVLGVVVSLARHGFGTEAAAWAQGAGTVAAILSAAWLADAESRRQRRQRRREREESAWSVQFAIRAARNEAATISEEMFNPARTASADDGRHWKTRCRNARLLLASYAGRSDHIHPAIVQDANNAVLLIEQLEVDLEAALADLARGGLVSIPVAENLAWYEIQLNELVQRIDDRMAGVREALDRGGDMLPIHEFSSRR
jgi:hypothetical protein